MKKYTLLVLSVLLLVMLVGCGDLVHRERTDRGEIKNNDTPIRYDTDGHISDTPAQNDPVKNTSSPEYLPAEDIKLIVLTHANLTEDVVERYNIHLDYDDYFRRYEYEISFYADKYEYDYEVDAVSGDIIDFDKEHIFD